MPRCLECNRPTPTLRLDKCSRCYLRAYSGRNVDGECAVCGQNDPRVLIRRKLNAERADRRLPGERRTRVLGGEYVTLCGNHAALATSPTMTLEALRSITPVPPSVR